MLPMFTEVHIQNTTLIVQLWGLSRKFEVVYWFKHWFAQRGEWGKEWRGLE